ncbi:MAG: GAF domain-containing protein [Chloroflexota bacterium]
MFRLLRYFSLTSLFAFITVTILLAIFYRQVAINDLVTLAESNNVALTQSFANSVWPEYGSFVSSTSDINIEDLVGHPENKKLREAVFTQMEGLSVLKVKVYNLDGLTVFSTEAEQIGDDKSEDKGFLEAKNGEVASELTHRDTFSAFEGTIENRDVISSYIPIFGGDDGNEVEGVFEVYDDVTGFLQQIETTQRNIIIGVVLILGLLYVSLYFIIRRADNILRTTIAELQTAEKKLEESHGDLELGIEDRTEDLLHRLTQIRAAAEISRLITGELNPDILMRKVVDLVKDRFGLYYAGVFLLDEDNLFAELKTGTGEAGRRMVAERHKLSVGGSSMVGWATANRQARIALDVGQEAIRFNNPHLPRTRSELALPLLRGNEPIGALTIQSTEAEAFDNDDIVVLQGIADTLATAIENANLFQQIEQNLNEIRKLNRLYLQEGWSNVAQSEQTHSYAIESDSAIIGEISGNSLEVPLTLRDQQVIGNISLETDRRDWTSEEKEFIESISNQAAIALESARLLEDSTKRVKREQSLNQLTTRFSRSLDVDSLMQVVVQELGKLPHVNKVSLHIEPPTPDSKELLEEAI